MKMGALDFAALKRGYLFVRRRTRRWLQRAGLIKGAPTPESASRRVYSYILTLAAQGSAEPAPAHPVVAFIAPTYNTPPAYLDALVASVRAQTPGAWRLILSDDGSREAATLAWLDSHAGDADLTIVRSAENRGIAAATNAGLAAADTPWVGFVDHDDALAPHALDGILRALAAAPDCRFLYTDEAVADENLQVADVFFKPAFDPVLLSGVNYINHLALYRRDRLLVVGGMREGFEGSQDYDLVLRYTRGLTRAQCLHLPYPAYIWRRGPNCFSALHRDQAVAAARKALAEAYARDERPATIEPAVDATLHRVRLDARRATERHWPLVSVVIPSREALGLITQVLDGLMRTDYPALEIIVIDNGSVDPEVLALYERYRAGAVPFQAHVSPEPFNFSRAVNRGMAMARGDLLLLLNNDVEILDAGWLKEMVSCFDYPDVGVVGAKLLYPDGSLQHAGVIAGLGNYAGHWYIGRPAAFPGPMGRLWVRQSLSVVTGACFLISRRCLEAVGPFDEERFAVSYNDVDFCLRAVEADFRVVWTPFATLIHHESVSRGSDRLPENIERFLREQENLRARHASDVYADRAFNPWYSRDRSEPEPIPLPRLPDARH